MFDGAETAWKILILVYIVMPYTGWIFRKAVHEVGGERRMMNARKIYPWVFVVGIWEYLKIECTSAAAQREERDDG